MKSLIEVFCHLIFLSFLQRNMIRSGPSLVVSVPHGNIYNLFYKNLQRGLPMHSAPTLEQIVTECRNKAQFAYFFPSSISILHSHTEIFDKGPICESLSYMKPEMLLLGRRNWECTPCFLGGMNQT